MCSAKNAENRRGRGGFLTHAPITPMYAALSWGAALAFHHPSTSNPRSQVLPSCLLGEKVSGCRSRTSTATGRRLSLRIRGEKAMQVAALWAVHAPLSLSQSTSTLSIKDTFLSYNLFFLSNCSPEKVVLLFSASMYYTYCSQPPNHYFSLKSTLLIMFCKNIWHT